MSKKVLHLLDHSIPLQSGYTFRSCAILNQQQKLGYNIKAITSNRQGFVTVDKETLEGIEFYRVTSKPNLFDKFPIIKQLRTVRGLRKRVKQIINDWQPDIIHAHSPVLTAMAAIPIAQQLHIPLVYEIRAFWEDAAVDHGTHSETSLRYKIIKQLETRVCQQVDAITTICQGLKKDLLSRGINESKITVIPNAVDLSQFSDVVIKNMQSVNEVKTQYDLHDAFILGFIGSLYAYEGIDLAIRAFESVKKEIPNAKLLVVGGGPQFDTWQSLAKINPFASDIVFTHRVPHHQVQAFYQLIDVLVYPRKKMRLTDLVTPLKPLEAMAMGKCVVASDVGGHQELIRHGQNGLLFKANDVSDFTSQVVLLKNNALQKQLIENGKQFVATERNWPTSVARYKDVYAGCL